MLWRTVIYKKIFSWIVISMNDFYMLHTCAVMLLWVWTTPLGLPVVPLVYIINAGSSPADWEGKKVFCECEQLQFSIISQSFMTILLEFSILPRKIPSSSISPGCEWSWAFFSEEVLGTGGIIENWAAHFEATSCSNSRWSLVLSTMEISYKK